MYTWHRGSQITVWQIMYILWDLAPWMIWARLSDHNLKSYKLLFSGGHWTWKRICAFWGWHNHFEGTYRSTSEQGSQLKDKLEMKQIICWKAEMREFVAAESWGLSQLFSAHRTSCIPFYFPGFLFLHEATGVYFCSLQSRVPSGKNLNKMR